MLSKKNGIVMKKVKVNDTEMREKNVSWVKASFPWEKLYERKVRKFLISKLSWRWNVATTEFCFEVENEIEGFVCIIIYWEC